jgi:hypothetical protein
MMIDARRSNKYIRQPKRLVPGLLTVLFCLGFLYRSIHIQKQRTKSNPSSQQEQRQQKQRKEDSIKTIVPPLSGNTKKRKINNSNTINSTKSVFTNKKHDSREQHKRQQHPTHDGGDCQAFHGPRRPPWAKPEDMRETIQEFSKLYEKRPIVDNEGGMRFDHSFAAWYTLRQLQPQTVIESGAFMGHSTWLIRQILPKARIISLDPRKPNAILPEVEYKNGKDFQDFAKIDWKNQMGIDPNTTLIFLDDHQSGFRRVFREGRSMGFRRYILEDNYPFLHGDNLSLKWVCERQRKDEWPGVVKDNFGQTQFPQTWEEHVAQGDEAEHLTKYYYEFPPVSSEEFTKQTRYNRNYTTTPILLEKYDHERLVPKLPAIEFNMYTHFSYLELKD